MKNAYVSKLLSAFLVLCVLLCAAFVPALAKSSAVSASGAVVNRSEETVTSDYGGTVDQVLVSAGDYVEKGDPLITFATTGVYAPQDGTAYVMGEVGDSAENVTARYGAVAYLEPAETYSLTASVRNAYDSEANRIIHPGETVYLRGANDTSIKGEGRVTQVTGESFNVEVTSGGFESGDSVYVFRSSDLKDENRIGKGSLALQQYSALNGEGIIVNVNVEQGAPVKKGDLLFETLSGSFTGAKGDLKTVCAEKSGVISAVSVSAGSSLAAGGAVCGIYPDEGLRVEANITESDLKLINVGDPVRVEFSYFSSGDYSVGGVVESISTVSTEETASSDKEGQYRMIVKLSDNTGIFYGMSVVVTTDMKESGGASAATAEAETDAEDGKGTSDSDKKPERPASGEFPDSSGSEDVPVGDNVSF